VALIDGAWIAFPTHDEIERATFDMVVAGRVLDTGEVAIMMVEAEATKHTIELIAGGGTAPTEEIVAQGLEAPSRRSPSCAGPSPSWPAWPPSRPLSSRATSTTRTTSTRPSRLRSARSSARR